MNYNNSEMSGKYRTFVPDMESKRIGIHVLPQKTDQERRLAQFC